MANKRMFSMDIVDSDLFLDMFLSSQCLYFHLSMRADDDGFVNNPKKVIKIIGANRNQDYHLPDYNYIHEELSRKHVTLQLLWEEYIEECI